MFNINNESIYDLNELKKVVKKEKYINIISTPYAKMTFISKFIDTYLEENKKVIYIYGYVKSKDSNFQKTYIYRKYKAEKNVIFVHFEDINKIEEEYDLIIYDDISIYTDIYTYEIKKVMYEFRKTKSHIIIISVEPIQKDVSNILFRSIYEKPFAEPRLISIFDSTKKFINVDFTDYIDFFFTDKAPLIIFTKNEECSKVVHRFLFDELKYEKENVKNIIENSGDICFNYGKKIYITSNIKVLERLKKKKYNLLITNLNDTEMSIKELIFVCGNVNEIQGERSEVIFAYKKDSYSMTRAQKISERINVDSWIE